MITSNYILTRIYETKDEGIPSNRRDIGLIKGEAEMSLLYYKDAPAWTIELKFPKGKKIKGTYYATGSKGKEVKFYDKKDKAYSAFENLKEKFKKISSYEDFNTILFPGGWMQTEESGYPPVDIDGTDNKNVSVAKSVSIKIGSKSIVQSQKKLDDLNQLRQTVTSASSIPTIDRLSRMFYQK
jgi:hypothetical protein